jgi:hypothetical protein
MLPVSTMVNNYCSKNDDCNTNSGVRAIISTLEELIGTSCYVNNKNIEQVSSRSNKKVVKCILAKASLHVKWN